MNKQNNDFYNEIICADSLRFSVVNELIKQDGDITIVNFTAIERMRHFYIHELKNASLENVKQSKMFQAYKLCDEIIDCLKCMQNLENGDLMFKGIFKSDDFYEGNELTTDIILCPFNEEYLTYGDSYWADIVSRNTQTRWHRSESICGGLGPNISQKVVPNKRDSVDIVQTINYLIGISNESYIGKSWIK